MSATSTSELTKSDVCHECETQFDEDQQLEQVIRGQIGFKVYPFSGGILLPLCWISL